MKESRVREAATLKDSFADRPASLGVLGGEKRIQEVESANEPAVGDVAGLRTEALRVRLVDVPRFTLLFLILVTGVVSASRADFAQDLVRIHTEAVGGRERIDALKALRATGVTRSERGDLRFVFWSARPNLLRTEVTSGSRTITQGWDGKTEPWLADSQTGRVTALTGDRAEELKVEAEFDDPLLAGADRRVSLDYGGAVELGKRELLKILVTQNFTEVSFIYLDPTTYLIVRRDVVRRRGDGEMTLRTNYSDFRPVAGVLLPHRLAVYRNGTQLHETVIERIEANPKLPKGIFEPPVAKTE